MSCKFYLCWALLAGFAVPQTHQQTCSLSYKLTDVFKQETSLLARDGRITINCSDCLVKRDPTLKLHPTAANDNFRLIPNTSTLDATIDQRFQLVKYSCQDDIADSEKSGYFQVPFVLCSDHKQIAHCLNQDLFCAINASGLYTCLEKSSTTWCGSTVGRPPTLEFDHSCRCDGFTPKAELLCSTNYAEKLLVCGNGKSCYCAKHDKDTQPKFLQNKAVGSKLEEVPLGYIIVGDNNTRLLIQMSGCAPQKVSCHLSRYNSTSVDVSPDASSCLNDPRLEVTIQQYIRAEGNKTTEHTDRIGMARLDCDETNRATRTRASVYVFLPSLTGAINISTTRNYTKNTCLWMNTPVQYTCTATSKYTSAVITSVEWQSPDLSTGKLKPLLNQSAIPDKDIANLTVGSVLEYANNVPENLTCRVDVSLVVTGTSFSRQESFERTVETPSNWCTTTTTQTTTIITTTAPTTATDGTSAATRGASRTSQKSGFLSTTSAPSPSKPETQPAVVQPPADKSPPDTVGATVGIVLGTLAFLVLLGVGGFFGFKYFRRRRQRNLVEKFLENYDELEVSSMQKGVELESAKFVGAHLKDKMLKETGKKWSLPSDIGVAARHPMPLVLETRLKDINWHCNELQSFDGRRLAVLCQAPVPLDANAAFDEQTYPEFWKMVFTVKPACIVAIVDWKDIQKKKADPYWFQFDNSKGHCATYHNRKVTRKQVIPLRDPNGQGCGMLRTFDIRSTEQDGSKDNFTTCHINFTEWPDMRPLGSIDLLTTLVDTINLRLEKHKECNAEKIFIMHCSAGVGRSGVLLVCMEALRMLKEHGKTSAIALIRFFRQSRYGIVQSLDQYREILNLLGQYIAMENFGPWGPNKERGQLRSEGTKRQQQQKRGSGKQVETEPKSDYDGTEKKSTRRLELAAPPPTTAESKSGTSEHS